MSVTAPDAEDGARTHRTSVPPSDKQPLGARIRLVRKAADLDGLAHLDDEEKALGRALIDVVEGSYNAPITNTVGMWLNDPKFEKAYHFQYHQRLVDLCKELQADPDATGTYVRPGTVMHLLFLSVAKHFHWTWGMGALATIAPMMEGFDAEQVFMLDFPESEVWTEEQRVALIFAKAVLTLSVTDELMEQALELWGVKLTIRYIGLIGSLSSQALFMSAFNVAGRWNDAAGSEAIIVNEPTTRWELEEAPQ